MMSSTTVLSPDDRMSWSATDDGRFEVPAERLKHLSHVRRYRFSPDALDKLIGVVVADGEDAVLRLGSDLTVTTDGKLTHLVFKEEYLSSCSRPTRWTHSVDPPTVWADMEHVYGGDPCRATHRADHYRAPPGWAIRDSHDDDYDDDNYTWNDPWDPRGSMESME